MDGIKTPPLRELTCPVLILIRPALAHSDKASCSSGPLRSHARHAVVKVLDTYSNRGAEEEKIGRIRLE